MDILVQVGDQINEELTPFILAVVVEDSPLKKSPAKRRSTENNSEQPVKSNSETAIKGTLGATELQGSQEEYIKALSSEEFVKQEYYREYMAYGEQQPIDCKAKTVTKSTLSTTESQGSDEEHAKALLTEELIIQAYSKEYIHVPYKDLPSLSETDRNDTCMEATSESEMDEEQSDTTAMSSNETNPVPKASVADCDMEDNKSGYVMIVDAKECKSSNEKDSQGKDRNSSDKDETTNANESDICKNPKSFSEMS